MNVDLDIVTKASMLSLSNYYGIAPLSCLGSLRMVLFYKLCHKETSWSQ